MKGNLKPDVGIDQISSKKFEIMICDEDGISIGIIFGKTARQCKERAERICDAYNDLPSNHKLND